LCVEGEKEKEVCSSFVLLFIIVVCEREGKEAWDRIGREWYIREEKRREEKCVLSCSCGKANAFFGR